MRNRRCPRGQPCNFVFLFGRGVDLFSNRMDVSADLKGGTEQKGEVQKPTAGFVLPAPT